MKYCSNCDTYKSLKEFNFKYKEKNKRQAFCRNCQSRVHKEYYDNHINDYLAKNKRRQKMLSEFVNNLKDNPCMDCGGKFSPVSMDFDHRENKKYNISWMVRYNKNSTENILKEIEKCDLVCSNCH